METAPGPLSDRHFMLNRRSCSVGISFPTLPRLAFEINLHISFTEDGTKRVQMALTCLSQKNSASSPFPERPIMKRITG